jgi:hypothetical protein
MDPDILLADPDILLAAVLGQFHLISPPSAPPSEGSTPEFSYAYNYTIEGIKGYAEALDRIAALSDLAVHMPTIKVPTLFEAMVQLLTEAIEAEKAKTEEAARVSRALHAQAQAATQSTRRQRALA